jgi:hypothetical protein
MDGRPVLFKVRGRLKSANDPRRKHSPEFVADVLRTYARAVRDQRKGPATWAAAQLGLTLGTVTYIIQRYKGEADAGPVAPQERQEPSRQTEDSAVGRA